MGYTHYFRISQDVPADKFSKQLDLDIRKVLRKGKGVLGGGSGEGGPVEYGSKEIRFNGIGDNSHETCAIPLCKDLSQSFEFCKTAQKPYDKYVLACYFVLKMHLGEFCLVSSDGFGGGYIDHCVETAFEHFINLFPNPNLKLEDMFKQEALPKAKTKKVVSCCKLMGLDEFGVEIEIKNKDDKEIEALQVMHVISEALNQAFVAGKLKIPN